MSVHRSRQLSFITGMGLPSWSTGPKTDDDIIAAAAEAGYDGVQIFFPRQAHAVLDAGMAHPSAISPARTLDDVDGLLSMWAGEPIDSLTLHLGTGFESVDDGRRLVAETLERVDRHDVTVFIETHRGTLFQDPARVLGFVDEFPQLRFTADLSHWYTGVELVYGDLDAKLDALAPVFERCRMIHGRISNPGSIQVPVEPDDPAPYVAHFRRMWQAVLAGCAAADDTTECPFVVELLSATAYYARTTMLDGGVGEETDRWAQADVLWDLFNGLEEPT